MQATGDHLTVEAAAGNTEELPQIETVIADHLKRFAFREDLVFDWQAAR